MIPEGWKKEPLGKIIKHKKGFAFKRSDYKQKGVRLFRVSDATENNRNNVTAICISEDVAKRYGDYRLEKGDIIVSTVGSRPPLYDSMVGRAIKISENAKGWLLNQNQVKLTAQANILSDYLYYHLKTKRFILFIESLIRGNANQVSITLDELFCFEVPYPNIEEQGRIVEILNTWDTAITQAEQLIAAKTKSRNIILRQLYHSIRGNSKPLKAVAKIATGQSAPQDSTAFCDNGIPFIRVSCLEGLMNGLPETAFEKITPRYAELNRINVFEKNTIIFSKSGMSAKLPRLYRLKNKCYLVSHLAAICSTAIEPAFLHYYLESNHPSQLAQGEGFPSIRTSEIAEMLIPVPDFSMQKKISQFMDSITREIDLERVRLKLLKEQKRSLMQKLLTGQVRVKA